MVAKKRKRLKTTSIDYIALGQRLRAARKARGLNVSEAAKLTGMSTGVVSALELSEKRNPGLGSLVTFCRAYGCGLDEIVFGTSSPGFNESSSHGDMVSSAELERNGATASGNSSTELEGTDTSVVETDPYYLSLKQILDTCDAAEKDFMLRLVSTAHSEFAIVRNKMGERTA